MPTQTKTYELAEDDLRRLRFLAERFGFANDRTMLQLALVALDHLAAPPVYKPYDTDVRMARDYIIATAPRGIEPDSWAEQLVPTTRTRGQWNAIAAILWLTDNTHALRRLIQDFTIHAVPQFGADCVPEEHALTINLTEGDLAKVIEAGKLLGYPLTTE